MKKEEEIVQKLDNVGFQFGVSYQIWGFPLCVSFSMSITSVRFFCFYVLIIFYWKEPKSWIQK